MRLIDADALIEWLRPYGHMDEKVPFDVLVEDINGQPTIDAEPVRHGRWEKRDGKTWCSLCGASNKAYEPPYCPHCGAKMDGGGE